jgi:cobaltochelatase CobN
MTTNPPHVDGGGGPRDIIALLTTADTELIALAAARRRLPAGCAEVRGLSCAGWTAADVEAHLVPLLGRLRCVAMRLLGGRRAIPEAVDRLAGLCAEHAVRLVAWPGDLTPDPELSALSTLDAEVGGRGLA